MTCRPKLELHTLICEYYSTLITQFPRYTLMNQITYQIPYALVGCHVTASILNGIVAGPVSIALVVGQTEPVITLSAAARPVAMYSSVQDAFFGLLPVVFNDWCKFHHAPVEIPAGCPIGFYLCSDLVSIQEVFAVASLQLARTI